jgi:hypothetical protein
MSETQVVDEIEDDECDGDHIERPHQWWYGGADGRQFMSAVCQRSGCRVMGTGDRCGDGECEGA